MESLRIAIADKNQLIRFAISEIISRLGYTHILREISDEYKLKPILQKDHYEILIISQSFLELCSSDTITFLVQKRNQRIVLLNDKPGLQIIEKNEMIEINDSEKTISHKLENSFLHEIKTRHPERSSEEISNREKEVLKLVALGLANKEIAERLYISMHTVITHRKNIASKLGIRTIAGLTVYAIINKLIDPNELNK